ncbi:MAG: RNA-binding S4 domain-containing protein [Rhizobiaceae bacterium]
MNAEAKQRLDKWLFFARVIKSRTLAARLVEAGRVRINGNKVTQPAASVKPGDVLTMTVERRVLVYRVVGAGERRGPAPEARGLYEDITPPPVVDLSAPEVIKGWKEKGRRRQP